MYSYIFPEGLIALTSNSFISKFIEVFANENYRELFLIAIQNTLIITSMALVLGVIIGILIGVTKYINVTTGKLVILNAICNLYTTIIRGTPVTVQLLIIYYMIFQDVPSDYKVIVAALSFGINSGAYVAEIIRGGLMSVDKGQSETGRSLGLNGFQTMKLVIMPQAVKNILPSLFNEFIALLKETSVAGYITVMDITYAADMIKSRTWSFEPYIISALIYLILVVGLTGIQRLIEGRFARSDKG